LQLNSLETAPTPSVLAVRGFRNVDLDSISSGTNVLHIGWDKRNWEFWTVGPRLETKLNYTTSYCTTLNKAILKMSFVHEAVPQRA
jgi:hypothetical protein